MQSLNSPKLSFSSIYYDPTTATMYYYSLNNALVNPAQHNINT